MAARPATVVERGLPQIVLSAAVVGNTQAVAAWLNGGGGVDARCAELHGATLLMAAAIGGQKALVRMLLQRGASINLQNSDGITALMVAADGGHTTIVQELFDAKADASLQSVEGSTALMMAEQRKHTATAQLLRQHAKRQPVEAEASAAASMAHAAAAADAMAAELLGEEAAEKEAVEKEAAAKKGKGKKKKAKPPPKATTTGAGSSAGSVPPVPELPLQAASGPQAEARAAAAAQMAAQKAASDAAAEQAQAEATAAERAAVERAAEAERALEEGIVQSVASHAAEEQRRAAIQAATPPPAAAPPPPTLLPPPAPPLPPPPPSPPPRAGPLVLAYLELQTATGDFAQVVGTGGFASVYRTEGALPSLPHHGPCAVKRLTAEADAAGGRGGGRGGERGGGRGGGRGVGRGGCGCGSVAMEVLKEVALLGRCTPHASLLPLLGYCLESSRQPCLVYPLCAGGTFEDRLLLTSAGFDRLAALGWPELPLPLTILQRLTILRDAARALVHLHAQQPVLLHGDVAAPSE